MNLKAAATGVRSPVCGGPTGRHDFSQTRSYWTFSIDILMGSQIQ